MWNEQCVCGVCGLKCLCGVCTEHCVCVFVCGLNSVCGSNFAYGEAKDK